MKEGEPELGGLQVPHRDADASIPTPGPQPDPFATLSSRPFQSQPSPQIPVSPAPRSPVPQAPASQAPSQSLAQPIAQPTPPASAPAIATGSPAMSLTSTPRQFSTQSISSGTGDILLSPAPAKKSKKWPIIAIVSTLALLVVGLGIGLFVSFNSNSQLNSQNTQAMEAYNQYANYVINGIESDDVLDINNYPDIFDYALYDVANPVKAEDAISISKATELFKTFKDLYTTDNPDDQEIINDCYNDLNLLETISNNEINASSFIKYAADSNKEAVMQEIETEYEKFNSLESPNASEYASSRKSFEENLFNLFVNMDAHTCFTVGYELAVDTCSTENIEDYVLAMSTSKVQLWDTVKTIKESIIADTWYLCGLVNGMNVEEGEMEEEEEEEEEAGEYENEYEDDSEEEDEEI